MPSSLIAQPKPINDEQLRRIFDPIQDQPVINQNAVGMMQPPSPPVDAPLPPQPLSGQQAQGQTGPITVDPNNERVKQIFGAFSK